MWGRFAGTRVESVKSINLTFCQLITLVNQLNYLDFEIQFNLIEFLQINWLASINFQLTLLLYKMLFNLFGPYIISSRIHHFVLVESDYN